MPSETPPRAAAALLRLEEVAPTPWKNGGGRTRELCVFPPDSDLASFAWRVSIAEVDADGAFSAFAGIDRTIVLLDGPGFRMHMEGAGDQAGHDLSERFVPFAFAGEAAVTVALHGGATRDFNLMVRRSEADGRVAIVTASGRLPDDTVLLYVAQGGLELVDADGASLRLDAGMAVRLRAACASPEVRCDKETVAIAVRIVLRMQASFLRYGLRPTQDGRKTRN
jgi:environmental stress-induced protein Ves